MDQDEFAKEFINLPKKSIKKYMFSVENAPKEINYENLWKILKSLTISPVEKKYYINYFSKYFKINNTDELKRFLYDANHDPNYDEILVKQITKKEDLIIIATSYKFFGDKLLKILKMVPKELLQNGNVIEILKSIRNDQYNIDNLVYKIIVNFIQKIDNKILSVILDGIMYASDDQILIEQISKKMCEKIELENIIKLFERILNPQISMIDMLIKHIDQTAIPTIIVQFSKIDEINKLIKIFNNNNMSTDNLIFDEYNIKCIKKYELDEKSIHFFAQYITTDERAKKYLLSVKPIINVEEYLASFRKRKILQDFKINDRDIMHISHCALHDKNIDHIRQFFPYIDIDTFFVLLSNYGHHMHETLVTRYKMLNKYDVLTENVNIHNRYIFHSSDTL